MRKKAFENNVGGKRRKCWQPAFPFPIMFSTLTRTSFVSWTTCNLSATAFSLDHSQILLFCEMLSLSEVFLNIFECLFTHYHTTPTFNISGKESLGKHGGKRRKMLVTSIFSFFHCFLLFPT